MTSVWIALCRVAALVAVSASAALYVQYLDPAGATYCGLESGCEAVRRSSFGYFGSRFLSMPLVGLVGYSVVYWVSLKAPGGRALRLLSAGGALAALGLVFAQAFVIKEYCWLCMTVDAAAVLVAVFAWLHARQPSAGEPLSNWAWATLFGIAVVSPLVWPQIAPTPPVPGVVRALYVPGKINVVEFADFECPHCRRLHPVLKDELAAYPSDAVHFVRMNVPLPGHPNAEPAARAYLCAAHQGKGEAMADALVSADLEEQPPRKAAIALGLELEPFDACVSAPETARRIEHETQVLRDAGMHGLPTTYIGGKRLLGSVEAVTIRDALERAARGEEKGGISGKIFAALVAALSFAVAWFGRKRRDTLHHGAQN